MTFSKISSSAIGARPTANGLRKLDDQNSSKSFKDLDVWKLSKELTKQIYKWTQGFPDTEKFGLTNQMRRCAISISSNIAEGFGREYANDKRMFYITAKGSSAELESQIIISCELGLLAEKKSSEGQESCNRIQQMLKGLIRSMESKHTSFSQPNR